MIETEPWFCSEKCESGDQIAYIRLSDYHFHIATFSIISSQALSDTGQQDKQGHYMKADKRTHFQMNWNFIAF